MAAATQTTLDTHQIREWRSILTLVVFVLTNIVVLIPFHIPLPIPSFFVTIFWTILEALRVVPRRQTSGTTIPSTGDVSKKEPLRHSSSDTEQSLDRSRRRSHLYWARFPMNFITAPLIADLLLLATGAIGRQEVHDGTVGANHIQPIDVMAFFITLAYIAISIDASGLIRYISYVVLQKGGGHGRRLYLYLYTFFFALACFIGNDPIVLSGTPFLAYMTRMSSNIENPRAWIFTQFAVSNVGSAILVSSNPTNLVLAGAFTIKFIDYTANMIVPVLITAILLCPFLLFFVFRRASLVPRTIELHKLTEEEKAKPPRNPNIPNTSGEAAGHPDGEKALPLEEILNPYLDKPAALFGSVIMAATLITILALNAATPIQSEHPVYWITLPAAVVMLGFDLITGWLRRKDTRELARSPPEGVQPSTPDSDNDIGDLSSANEEKRLEASQPHEANDAGHLLQKPTVAQTGVQSPRGSLRRRTTDALESSAISPAKRTGEETSKRSPEPTTLYSIVQGGWRWGRETFPTATAVLALLPLPLVPFALCMFVLVQGLVTRGWVAVFAYGWSHWVNKTHTLGAIGGMAFLSIVLCNFAGTNIGTTILLSRVVQAWVQIHAMEGAQPISQRTFWATVYSMALGVNYGAFSTAFSASLAGLLWRDILARKHIQVTDWQFAKVNFPIISVATIIGCAVLVGEVYLMRSTEAYGGN